MGQQRDAPAYQEYAAQIMSRIEYRQMSLAERGLFVTLRYECWVNQAVPQDPATLARILGFSTDEVKRTLPAVMSFFRLEGNKIICPELENYRAHISEIRRKQSAGGKKGMNSRYSRKASNDGRSSGVSDLQGSNKSVDQYSTVQSSTTQSPEKGVLQHSNSEHEDFLSDYESNEHEYPTF